MRKSLISIDGVSYSYSGQRDQALKSLDLEIEAGEVLAIMGPTGAGKTTLVSLLNGLIPHFFEGEMKGEVCIGQQSTYNCTIQDLAGSVGLVLQDPETQIFGITVLEDTTFGPRNLAYPKEDVLNLVSKALDQVNLSGFEERATKDLSGGEKQRLAIAGVLAMQPPILVLDEPVSELDPAGRIEIQTIIEKLKSQKESTVVFVEHDPEFVLKLADRVAVLSEGALVWQGKPADLFRDVQLTKSFSIKPPQTAQFGTSLLEKGLIKKSEIPLNISEANQIIQKFIGDTKISFSLPKEPRKEKEVSAKPIIEASKLSHQYPNGIQALQEINCKIYPGEFIAVIGHNGAGKSTFTKHLNGLLKPSKGKIIVNNLDTKTASIQELAQHVGYVFQNPDHQIFSATVEDELRFGLTNIGLSKSEQDWRINEALETVGLASKRDRHPFTLGKGERQKVAVASILAIAPPIICIDEPTTGLDWEGSMQMMRLIAKLNEKGHTILMISHDMEIVLEFAERVLVFNHGCLIGDGRPTAIFSDKPIVEKAGIVPPPLAMLTNSNFSNLAMPHPRTADELAQAVEYIAKGNM